MLKRFHILHTNDIHSHFEQMTRIHTFVSTWRQTWCEQGEQGLLLDIGDHLDRSRLETEGTDGMANHKVLEATKYDVVTLGNNEWLTFTKEQLNQLYEHATYDVIASNICELPGTKRPSWLRGSSIYEIDGIRVGFIGAIIPFDFVYEEMGWIVEEPIQAIQKKVNLLRSQVDVVVVLSHLGIHYDRMLANQVPGIDLIIGAHTHHLFETTERIGSTLLAASGKFGEYVGHITVELDLTTRHIIHMQGYSVSVTKEREDRALKRLIEKQRSIAEQRLEKPIRKLESPLYIDWQKESHFSNLLADCLCEWMGVDIGLVNSGQILHSISAGIVTRKMLHQLCPHPINPAILEIDGRELRLTLEQSLLSEYTKKEIRGYGFRGKILGSLAVSGMQVTYDPNQKPYQKIQAIDIGGRPLQEDKTYEIASVDMFLFGIGYPHLEQERRNRSDQHHFLRDVLAWGLQNDTFLERCQTQRWYVHPRKKGIED